MAEPRRRTPCVDAIRNREAIDAERPWAALTDFYRQGLRAEHRKPLK